jgi:hypothetical protein
MTDAAVTLRRVVADQVDARVLRHLDKSNAAVMTGR